MFGPPKKYFGDARMAKHLRGIDAPCSLHGIYGLFHGCVAAPVMVPPSEFIPMILGEGEFTSDDHAKLVFGNIMALWNLIAQWNPLKDPFPQPTIRYPVTPEGIVSRISDWNSLTEYFIKGLDLGGTGESDFSDDALDALKYLAEAQSFLEKYPELLKTDTPDEKVPEETVEMLIKLEDIIVDCIARVNAGLKTARMTAVENIRRNPEPTEGAPMTAPPKIGRNQPCPCGSGKKHKRCCGFLH